VQRAFLSYRRSDSDYALLLYEFLKQNFGRDRVFLDTDYIEPGENFVQTLERELASCGAFVALIGRGWIESLSRLQEDRDYVRMEIAFVLARGGASACRRRQNAETRRTAGGSCDAPPAFGCHIPRP
jgi:TIR domain